MDLQNCQQVTQLNSYRVVQVVPQLNLFLRTKKEERLSEAWTNGQTVVESFVLVFLTSSCTQCFKIQKKISYLRKTVFMFHKKIKTFLKQNNCRDCSVFFLQKNIDFLYFEYKLFIITLFFHFYNTVLGLNFFKRTTHITFFNSFRDSPVLSTVHTLVKCRPKKCNIYFEISAEIYICFIKTF